MQIRNKEHNLSNYENVYRNVYELQYDILHLGILSFRVSFILCAVVNAVAIHS